MITPTLNTETFIQTKVGKLSKRKTFFDEEGRERIGFQCVDVTSSAVVVAVVGGRVGGGWAAARQQRGTGSGSGSDSDSVA